MAVIGCSVSRRRLVLCTSVIRIGRRFFLFFETKNFHCTAITGRFYEDRWK